MTRYQVDSDIVMGTTARVRATIETIQGDVAGLMRQLTELQSSWTGDASVAFQAIVSDWRATQQRVEESITMINSALGRAGSSYQEVERGNADLFRIG
jgi:early secretory antigenic target protein ESAT-6